MSSTKMVLAQTRRKLNVSKTGPHQAVLQKSAHSLDCSYYRRFFAQYSKIAKPLHALTEKKVKFEWSTICEKALNTFKRKLTTGPLIAGHRCQWLCHRRFAVTRNWWQRKRDSICQPHYVKDRKELLRHKNREACSGILFKVLSALPLWTQVSSQDRQWLP